MILRSMVFVFGLLTVIGAVGTLDVDPDASLLLQGGVALVGLILMSLAFPIFRKG